MNGVPGSRYSFQVSCDLKQAQPQHQHSADATGHVTFTDTNAGNLYPFRFYRSLRLP